LKKKLNSAPKILKDDIANSFLELSTDEINSKDPIYISDNTRNLRQEKQIEKMKQTRQKTIKII